ncbi:TadE/TadG family type IV pilus assembly protein [Brucella gallinifaecis]|uniref:Pilus assembly protein n=1 Tax=Brucella gallinifaecis TaxID=215590 RepID=A0A502BP65_9HYPH|nr:TadE/TadG family type IV pilus assembly protein [Brucella gallinifaecis]TPF75441.1 pilus assembly protein [Brucella gallinifaecis]
MNNLYLSILNKKSIRKFYRSDDGAAAVEFAIIAFPLIVTIITIIYLSVVFIEKQVLANSIDETTRQMKIASRLNPMEFNADKFRIKLCENNNKSFKINCDKLNVHMVGYNKIGEFRNFSAPISENNYSNTNVKEKISIVFVKYNWSDILSDNKYFNSIFKDFFNTDEVRLWTNE